MDGQLSLDDHISPEEANRLIDEAIEHHHKDIEHRQVSILALKSQKNTFAPISRLPPEIFCKIFFALRTSSLNAYRLNSKLSWIKVTHVSRHWRNTAIASPTLWTFIDDSLLHNIPWLEETLSRSKEARLAIHARVKILRPSDVRGLKLVLEHSQRINDLSISIVIAEWLEMQSLLPKSIPQLEYLSLSGSSPMTIKPVYPSEEALCDTPKLRQLALINIDVNWETLSRFKSYTLTHLKVHELLSNSRPTWKQLLDVLKGTPNLEVLDLKDALPLPTSERMPLAFEPVYLSFLQTLLLDCSTVDVKEAKACFFYITFPLTTSVRIECSNYQFSALDILDRLPDFLLALSQLFPNAYPDMHPQTLILFQDYSWSPEVRLKLYTEALADEQMLAHNHILPRLELAFEWLPDPFSSIQKDVANITNLVFDSALPLQDISHVCLTGMLMESDPIALANAVGKLPRVCFVMATKNTHRALLDVLQLDLGTESAANPGKAPYFPNLSSIFLYGMALWEDREDEYDDQHLISVEQLYNCLAQRCEVGVEIKKLTLKAYPLELDKDNVELLRGIISEIDSDHERYSVKLL